MADFVYVLIFLAALSLILFTVVLIIRKHNDKRRQ